MPTYQWLPHLKIYPRCLRQFARPGGRRTGSCDADFCSVAPRCMLFQYVVCLAGCGFPTAAGDENQTLPRAKIDVDIGRAPHAVNISFAKCISDIALPKLHPSCRRRSHMASAWLPALTRCSNTSAQNSFRTFSSASSERYALQTCRAVIADWTASVVVAVVCIAMRF